VTTRDILPSRRAIFIHVSPSGYKLAVTNRNSYCIYLAASTDWKLSESANIINEQIHESQLVAESNHHIKTARMQSYAVSFLSKFLVQLQVAAIQENASGFIFQFFLSSVVCIN